MVLFGFALSFYPRALGNTSLQCCAEEIWKK
jgi:hypothetical protein